MLKSLARYSYLWLAIILTLFLSLEYWIVQSIYFSRQPELFSIGVAIDLTLGIPALFYFLLVRPKKYSPLTLVPVFLISFGIATVMIPSAYQNFLTSEKKIIPLIEVGLIAYVVSKIPGLVRRYREIKDAEYFFADRVRKSFGDVFFDNKAVNILLSEFLLMYLAFGGWFMKSDTKQMEHPTFTYHHKSAYSTILGVMIALLCIETIAFHIILLHWSKIAAVIMTALSIYSLFWLIGDFHAIRLHPVLITDNNIQLRIGLRWKATIPISAISGVDFGGGPPRNSKGYVRASVLTPRVVLNLNQTVNVQALFGMVRHASKIGLSIDDAEKFRDEILKRKEAV
jgi:hypothetical protein